MFQAPLRQRPLRTVLALALLGVVSLSASAGHPPDSEHTFSISGTLGSPVPWQVSDWVGIDKGLRLRIELPDFAVGQVEAVATQGTVHLYLVPSSDEGAEPFVPTYVRGDPVPAVRKTLVVAEDSDVIVEPGPGGLYKIDVRVRGFYGDPVTGSPAAIQVHEVAPRPCPWAAVLPCPP